MDRFEDVSKLLFTKVVDERQAVGTWPGTGLKGREDLQWRSGDTPRTVYERARAVWTETVAAYPDVFDGARAQFPRDVNGVARIVSLLESCRLSALANDIKGKAYEEMLQNTFEKNDNQQYFTPRHVVEFMVELASPTDSMRLCDPASGSGGFLVGALN
jgi:type I restriction enzyme M protein